MKTGTIPEHFVSLNQLGYNCSSCWTGDKGKELGLTRNFLMKTGLIDGTLWIHRDVLNKLSNVRTTLQGYGFDMLVKEAYRPIILDLEINRLLKEANLPADKLINLKDRSHSTGMALDVVLCDFDEYVDEENEGGVIQEIGEEVDMKDPENHSPEINHVDYCVGKQDADNINYQNLRILLVKAFLNEGFVLGIEKDFFHFQLPQAVNAKEY